jgi:hypothetical protein
LRLKLTPQGFFLNPKLALVTSRDFS